MRLGSHERDQRGADQVQVAAKVCQQPKVSFGTLHVMPPTYERSRTVFVSMCMGQAAMTFVAQRLLPRLDEPVVLFTMSRDITLPLQRTCGGDPVDGHCKYDDYTVEQWLGQSQHVPYLLYAP